MIVFLLALLADVLALLVVLFGITLYLAHDLAHHSPLPSRDTWGEWKYLVFGYRRPRK